MSSLKEVRLRIESIKSTQQITSAMKLVAASKLRKSQNAILTLRPYASKLNGLIQDISASLEESDETVYAEKMDPEKVLLVIITSNRGLCGAFNSNVIKLARFLIYDNYMQQYEKGNLSLYCIGKKGYDYFKRHKYNILETNLKIFDNLSFENVAPIAVQLMQDYKEKKFDRIEIIYNQFKNATTQILINEQFLPIQPHEPDQDEGTLSGVDYIFEPEKEQIVRELIPKSLKIQLYKAILDSFASEHGARMTAMHMATDNAQELLKELRLSYNKARQASITNEIIEIVSGSIALIG
ncbi:MAG: ATP synthase F1 subunit gamma [Bacteroidetes bacterium]|nr:ATP synthase F1 subunit gamma [Bacteroidota bacterium]